MQTAGDSQTEEGRGYDARFAPHLYQVEDRHFWFRSRNLVIETVLRRLESELAPGYRALEIGCGTGNTLRVLQNVCTRGTVVGLDFQRDGLAYARGRVTCPLVQADACRPPFLPDVRFSLVCVFDVIEHLDDDRQVLRSLRNVAALPGALLVTVPAVPALWSAFDDAAHHRRRYTPESLRDVLTDSGFTVEYLSPFMMVLYPLLWARRRWSRGRSGRAAFDFARQELRIVPGVNELLAWGLSREASFIDGRRRLPFGTSLIAVARPNR